MASKNGKTVQIQDFVRGQITEVQKTFASIETEAEKALKNLVARGQESRKELEALVKRVNSGDFNPLEADTVQKVAKKANQAGNEVLKKLDGLQAKVIEVTGVASQSQIKELSREIARLSKKVDTLLNKKGAKPEARA